MKTKEKSEKTPAIQKLNTVAQSVLQMRALVFDNSWTTLEAHAEVHKALVNVMSDNNLYNFVEDA